MILRLEVFISADDISYLDSESIGGLNLFAHCGNNPIMNIDTTGYLAANVMKCVNALSAGTIFASYASMLYTAFAATLAKITAKEIVSKTQ